MNANYPKLDAVWQKMSLERRVALDIATRIMFHGQSISEDRSMAEHCLSSARFMVESDMTVQQLTTDALILLEGTLTKNPDWTEADLYQHVVGVITGREKIGDHLHSA